MKRFWVPQASVCWTCTSCHGRYHTFSTVARRLGSFPAIPSRLDLQAIDQKWQMRWKDAAAINIASGRPKSYVLAMFPYPSGALHMGHLRVYTIADILARFKRMQGHDVIYPMGWDAFGLPAENAAIEKGVSPTDWTLQNISKMKKQLMAMNGDMDWSKEFMTCDPSFYKHTQRLFLLLHERGLAYQAESLVNYDPIDRTVLANEQVDGDGYSWRSGAKVEKISLRQWFFRTTAFRETLLDDLDSLEGWPERVLSMQRNWIGRSKGATIRFSLDCESRNEKLPKSVEVFTTRADTLFGAQYICLSASHPLIVHYSKTDPRLSTFVESIKSLPANSKAGYKLPGVHARNPLSSLLDTPDDVHEPLPVFVAPYVLEDYGEGAVMGVPAHDSRDFAFWKHNQTESSIRSVVVSLKPGLVQKDGNSSFEEEAFTTPGFLSPSCGKYAGLSSQDASNQIMADLNAIDHLAAEAETWRLRDWLISRQRYWGTPIPIIHCKDCGAVPVPVKDLPVELPKVEEKWFKGMAGKPLEKAEEWLNVPCPSCKGPARRDTDTMDTFVCSSWYMFRFTDPCNPKEPFSPEKANALMPVDIYVGGIEHAILHLLYARFISKFLATTSLWPSGSHPSVRGEPFRRLVSQGMVHGKTYSDPQTGRFLKPEEVDLSDPSGAKIVATGETPRTSFEKMSKSKHNGVDPTAFITKYGADVTRAHIIFQAPVSDVLEWEEDRIVGIQRWFQRIYRLSTTLSSHISSLPTLSPAPLSKANPSALSPEARTLYTTLQKTIASVSDSLSDSLSLNTCISDLMSLTNALAAIPPTQLPPALAYETLSSLLRLLAPFAPAFTEECWEVLHATIPAPVSTSTPSSPASPEPTSIFAQPYPAPLPASELARLGQTQTCAVMENGRLRFTLEIEVLPEGMENEGERRECVLERIRGSEIGGKWLKEKGDEEGRWKRVVVVGGGRTVNFVG